MFLLWFGPVPLAKPSVPEEKLFKKNLVFYRSDKIPRGNSWVVNMWRRNQELISDKGIRNWNDGKTIIRTYF